MKASPQRRLVLQLRRGVKAMRRLRTELLETEPTRSKWRWTCSTCGHQWVTWEVVPAALASRFERYWQDGKDGCGTSGYCSTCTKAERDRRYPLPKV